MKSLFTQPSLEFGLPTTVTKMGANQTGPKAYVVEQSKYKALFFGALMMILSFVFLYGAFSSERSNFNHRSELLIQTEEHQRIEKQSAEAKLLQITQMLTTHLEQEKEEESEMKMLYVAILDSHQRGVSALEAALPDGSESLTAAKKVFNDMSNEIDGIVGTHERESRHRADRARALLRRINDQVIHELDHEAEDAASDASIAAALAQRPQQLELSAEDQLHGAEAAAVFAQMVGHVRAKADRLDAVADRDRAQFAGQLRAWRDLQQSVGDPRAVLSAEQLRRVVDMAGALPLGARRSAPAQALLRSAAGMPQHAVVKHVGELVAELGPVLHRARLQQVLDESQPNWSARAAVLELKRMASDGEVPNKWLSDAVEAHEAWQEDGGGAPARAATPPPVPARAAVQAQHARASAQAATKVARGPIGHDTSAL